MKAIELTKTKLSRGVWEGLIAQSGNTKPDIAVTHLGTPVPDVSLEQAETGGVWALRVPIPASAVSDGVQTLLITDRSSQKLLGQVTLVAGEALSEDLIAEVGLLRAELDMLKRTFRRHCQKER